MARQTCSTPYDYHAIDVVPTPSQRPSDPWRPIETAPKGSELDLWAGWRIPCCRWRIDRWSTRSGADIDRRVTHWMPIPAEPGSSLIAGEAIPGEPARHR